MVLAPFWTLGARGHALVWVSFGMCAAHVRVLTGTMIILPRRLSTIRSCNQIIVLHNGRIESVGQPRDLQNESKFYRHLQYVEFNQFATGDIEAGQMNA